MNKEDKELVNRWYKFSETVEADFISPGFSGNGQVEDFLLEAVQKREEEVKKKIARIVGELRWSSDGDMNLEMESENAAYNNVLSIIQKL